MPRYIINDQLSFRYPENWNIKPKYNGKAFRFTKDNINNDKEAYWVKWTNAKSPSATWDWLSSSPFDKEYKLEPLKRDVHVAGFTLKPLPDLRKLNLGHGQYASFRGSEYKKLYDGIEFIEMTWSRIYAYQDEKKIKFLGMGFTASGEAKTVADRVRSEFMNFSSGFIFKTAGIDKWERVKFPDKNKKPKQTQTAARPAAARTVTPNPRPSVSGTAQIMETTQCSSCYGAGSKPCSSCGGQGGRYESRVSYDWEGNPQYNEEFVSCYSCSGGYATCSLCGGKGYVYK